MKNTYLIEMWNVRKQKWEKFGSPFKATQHKARRELRRCAKMMRGYRFQLADVTTNHVRGYASIPRDGARENSRQDAG